MPDAATVLSDPQLLEVYHDPKADLSLLTPEEQTRLVKLTQPTGPPSTDGGGGVHVAVSSGATLPAGDRPDDVGVGALVSHAAQGLNPLTGIQTIGKALIPEAAARAAGVSGPAASTYGPVNAVRGVLAAQGVPLQKAQASYQAGDYATAARHFIDYLVPIAGPVMDRAADRAQAGHVMAGAGDALALGLSLFGPKGLQTAAETRAIPSRPVAPSPTQAAVQFGQDRGIPVDLATATDNSAIRGIQALADRSLAGTVVAKRAQAAQAAGLERVGGELADQVHPAAVLPEQAGTNVAAALTQKIGGLTKQANTAYDTVRGIEGRPENLMPVPLPPAPVDAIPADVAGQVRRIVHELDAMPYTQRLLQPAAKGSSLEHVPGTGGAGAAVFDDIVGRLEAGSPTRAVVQQQLEQYLGGGKETPIVRAALDVALERGKGQGGRTVGKPALPPSAMDVPTALEGTRETHAPMALPVPYADVKTALKPIYDQLARQLPLTQRQSDPGFNAIGQILDGPDWAPLSQADRDLSAIKTVARERGGLAKVAVQKLGAAVNQAAVDAGPEVSRALSQGRAATVAKYAATDVLESLKAEPVRTINAMTAPKDAGIQALRTVTREVPQLAPQIARAWLEDRLQLATADGGFTHADKLAADWSKLGTQTKALLFPKAGQVADLDHFFLLAKKMAVNPNPSQTAYVASIGAQGAALVTNPVASIVGQVGAAGLAALMHNPTAVRLLTRGVSLHVAGAPLPVQLAVQGQILKTARDMGLTAIQAQAPTGSPAPLITGAAAQ